MVNHSEEKGHHCVIRCLAKYSKLVYVYKHYLTHHLKTQHVTLMRKCTYSEHAVIYEFNNYLCYYHLAYYLLIKTEQCSESTLKSMCTSCSRNRALSWPLDQKSMA